MALIDLSIGEMATVTNVAGSDSLTMRLKMMGFFNGRPVEMLLTSRHKFVVKVGETMVGLAKEAVNRVEVQLTSNGI